MKDQSVDEISKRIHYSFSFILQAKLRNFFKRSLFRYLFSSVIFYYIITEIDHYQGGLLVFLFVFLGLLLLSGIVMLLSSYFQANKRKDKSFVLTLKENAILLIYDKTGLTEENSWDWIKKAELFYDTYYLDRKDKYKEAIIVKKSSLTAGENITLRKWLVDHRKMK